MKAGYVLQSLWKRLVTIEVIINTVNIFLCLIFTSDIYIMQTHAYSQE